MKKEDEPSNHKTKPTYSLEEVKDLIKGSHIFTPPSIKVQDGTNELGLSFEEAYQSILSLTRKDFHTSNPGNYNPKIWQDSYKKTIYGKKVYIKFRIRGDGLFHLTSFKEDK